MLERGKGDVAAFCAEKPRRMPLATPKVTVLFRG